MSSKRYDQSWVLGRLLKGHNGDDFGSWVRVEGFKIIRVRGVKALQSPPASVTPGPRDSQGSGGFCL